MLAILIIQHILFVMELRQALAIFKINERIPAAELNSSFRELVKKYHPDKVRDYPEWANERMSEINEAYETLTAWLKTPPPKPGAARTHETETEEHSAPGKRDQADSHQHSVPDRPAPLTAVQAERFYPAFDIFLNSIGTYYQYGLENQSRRGDGVRRFRYREAYRGVRKALERLKNEKHEEHPVISAVTRFIRLTVADMEFSSPRPSGSRQQRLTDLQFRNARKDFDQIVKEIFFPDLVPSYLHGQTAGKMYSCFAAFLPYLALEHERHQAGVLMMARYNALTDLLELRGDGLLDF